MTEILVFIFAALLLIGSISIAMPSKASERYQNLECLQSYLVAT